VGFGWFYWGFVGLNSYTLDFKVLLYGRAFGDHLHNDGTTQAQERNKPAIHAIVRTLDLILRVRTRKHQHAHTP